MNICRGVTVYHGSGKIAPTIVDILTKRFDQGQRTHLFVPDETRLKALDDFLWKAPKEGFLPHHLTPAGEMDPVILGADEQVLLDHCQDALLLLGPVDNLLERLNGEAILVFTEEDQSCRQYARELWRACEQARLPKHYYRQDSHGGWSKAG